MHKREKQKHENGPAAGKGFPKEPKVDSGRAQVDFTVALLEAISREIAEKGGEGAPAISERVGREDPAKASMDLLCGLDSRTLVLVLDSGGNLAPSVRHSAMVMLRERLRTGHKIGDGAVEATTRVMERIISGKDIGVTKGMAMEVLGEIGHFSAVPILARAMSDPDVNVWLRAANALKLAVEKNPGRGWDGLAQQMLDAMRCGKFGDIPDKILLMLGPDAVPHLKAAMKTDDAVGKKACALLLQIAIKHPGDVQVLWAYEEIKSLLSDEEYTIRREAAFAVGRMAMENPGDGRLAEAPNLLAGMLGDVRDEVADSAFRILVKMGAMAVPALAEALGKDDTKIISKAIEALKMIADAGNAGDLGVAVSALAGCLRHGDINVRRSAAHALLGMVELDSLGAEDKALCLLLLDRKDNIAGMGSPAVPTLIAALQDKDADMRAGAAMLLGKIVDLSAALPLLTALGDEKREVGFGALKALYAIAIVHPKEVASIIAGYVNGDGGDELLEINERNDWKAHAISQILLKCGEGMQTTA